MFLIFSFVILLYLFYFLGQIPAPDSVQITTEQLHTQLKQYLSSIITMAHAHQYLSVHLTMAHISTYTSVLNTMAHTHQYLSVLITMTRTHDTYTSVLISTYHNDRYIYIHISTYHNGTYTSVLITVAHTHQYLSQWHTHISTYHSGTYTSVLISTYHNDTYLYPHTHQYYLSQLYSTAQSTIGAVKLGTLCTTCVQCHTHGMKEGQYALLQKLLFKGHFLPFY